jgi:transcriptional regulator with XRE-family HTH domain
VPPRDRILDRARRRARAALGQLGGDLRAARRAAGLTQSDVAVAAGTSDSVVSRIELGESPSVAYELLVRVAAVVGLDLPLRAYPGPDPVRDQAQIDLLVTLRRRVHASLGWISEVPIGIARDLRAWDAVISGRGWAVAVEAETRLTDLQAVLRRVALKARDDNRPIVILVVADTRHNRHVLHVARDLVREAFPVSGSAALDALTRGGRPAGSAVVML